MIIRCLCTSLELKCYIQLYWISNNMVQYCLININIILYISSTYCLYINFQYMYENFTIPYSLHIKINFHKTFLNMCFEKFDSLILRVSIAEIVLLYYTTYIRTINCISTKFIRRTLNWNGVSRCLSYHLTNVLTIYYLPLYPTTLKAIKMCIILR